jgi:Xaa-Pro aminopeptidase
VEDAGWDALVALGVENVQYCSGAWVPYARGYLDRPNIVVWPKEGDPIYIAGAENISGIRSSHISEFAGYEENGTLPPTAIVEKLADVLRERELDDAVIGLEMLRTPVPFYESLVHLMPRVRFEPADAVLRRLRMVKTPAEIDTMTRGAQRTDEGIWRAFQRARAGQSELEFAASIQASILAAGPSAIVSILLGSGEGARSLSRPTDHELTPGEIVRLDLNSVTDGYFCDIGRMAVVGEPSDIQLRAYRDHWELKQRIFDFIRPGRTCAEVHAHYREQAERLGVELFIYPYIGLGHGTGVNNDEYPKLNGSDRTVIEAGMILNVEPDTFGPTGEVMHVEDMVLVKDDGVEVITWSRDWSDLPVIPA